ncbi:MAG: PAS domain-containing protein [Methylococcus sp.]
MKKVLPGLALAFLFLGLFIGGRSILQRHLQQAQALVNDQVDSIARLKVQQIAAWRKERLADAELLRVHPAIVADLLRSLANETAPRERGDTRTYLEALLRQYGYEGFLLIGPEGKVRYSSLETGLPRLDEEGQAALAEAWRTRRAVLSDLHAGADHPYPHLGVVAPLFRGDAPAGGLLLLVNAHKTLYPLIQSWPIPSASGEALLVRRDGDAVLFLNDLRHRENTALNLRLPLTQVDTPAAQAALGHSGVIEGLDYRGVPVLSVGLPVPESTWFLIAKIDSREALAPARREARVLVGGLIVALGLLILLAALAWQRHQRKQTQTLEAAESAKIESLQRFQHLFDQSIDGILLMRGEGHRFLDANPAALQMLGYTRDELLGLRMPDILAAQEHQRLDLEVALTLGGVPHHQEWIAKRKDGSTFIAEATAKALDPERYFSVFRDITERKRIERELLQTTERLQAMLTALPDLMFRVDLAGNILDFRSSALELLYLPPEHFLGRKIAEVLPANAAAIIMAALEEAAAAGHHHGAVYALPMPRGERW